MPKLVIGMQNKSHASAGFTLIEIMVVVLIVGITLGFALLAFGDFGSKRRVVMAAEQFINFVNFIEQQAILETTTLGIQVNPHEYQALRFSNNWQPMSNQSRFHRYSFPDNAVVFFNNSVKQAGPQIIINSSGDITPFTLTFGTSSEAKMVKVVGLHNGTVKLEHVSS